MLTPKEGCLMKKLGHVFTGLICIAVASCGADLPDLTVTATHKDMCIDGKPGVEVLEAKIVNAGAGTVVLAGDETKPWVSARPSLPLPDWATPHPMANTTTLKPGESVSIPIKVIAPSRPDNAPYKLIVEVDPNQAYAETNENNNQYEIPVSAPPCNSR
jgi:hypothetical protein